MKSIINGITALFLIYVLFIYNDGVYFQQIAGALAQWFAATLTDSIQP